MTTEPHRFARDGCAHAPCADMAAAVRPDGRNVPERRRTVSPVSGRLLAIETSCDETAVAVVERGRRIHADVVASQVALHARTGGIVPEVAARAHLRWMIPVLDEACRRAGVDRPARHRRHRGHGGSRVSPARCSWASRWPARSPGSTTCRWCPSTTTRATSTRRGCSTPTKRSAPSRLCPLWPGRQRRPHVPGAHPRPPGLPPPGRHDRRRGGRGVRQGRPPAGAAVPGRAGHLAAAAAATRHDRRFPRAWLGDSDDFSFSGLKTAARRQVADALGPDADPASRTVRACLPTWSRSLRGRSRTRWWRCSRPRPCVPPAAMVRGASWLVAGSPPTGAPGPDRGGTAALGIPLVVPRPGLCTDNAAMIGAAGWRRFLAGERAGLDLDARPSYGWPAGCRDPLRTRRRERPRERGRHASRSHDQRGGHAARPDPLTELDSVHLGAEEVERYLRRHGLRANEALQPEPPRRRRGAGCDHRGVRCGPGARCWRSGRASAS